MTPTSLPIMVRIDSVLDQVQRLREQVVAETPSVRRSTRIAELYEREAHLWSALFEHTRIRVHWRAALSAEAYARHCAQHWRIRAACEARQVARRRADGWATDLQVPQHMRDGGAPQLTAHGGGA